MPRDDTERISAIARLIAVVAGIAGVLLCAVVPLLPVKQTTATIAWPQAPGPDGLVSDVTAPLVSGAPQTLDISIPCQVIATLPAEGGVVLSTVRQAADLDYRLTVLADACADRDPEVHRVLTEKVFPRQALVTTADEWISSL